MSGQPANHGQPDNAWPVNKTRNRAALPVRGRGRPVFSFPGRSGCRESSRAGFVYRQWLILTLTLEEGGFLFQPFFLGLGSQALGRVDCLLQRLRKN